MTSSPRCLPQSRLASCSPRAPFAQSAKEEEEAIDFE